MTTDRFLYFTDPHFGCSPKNRKDDFNESILKKLNFILELAEKEERVILCGGDLFDTPRIKIYDIIKMVRLLRFFHNMTFYTLRGNEGHDGVGDSSPLSMLEYANLVELPKYVDFENCRVIFKSHGADFDPEEYMVKGKKNILSTHSTIVKDKVPFDHTLINDYQTSADVVLLAHYHPEQGIIYNNNGTAFVSPGAVARKKKITHDMKRSPKACRIDVEASGRIVYDMVEIPCASDVWVEKGEFEPEIEENSLVLTEQIKEMKGIIDDKFVGLSLEESLRLYAAACKLPANVLEYSIERINTQ